MTDPRIYVACLASYNNGALHGEWINASENVDDMQTRINDMLAASRFPNVNRRKFIDGEGATHFVDVTTPAEKIPDDWEAQGESFPSAEEWAIHDSEGLGDIGEYESLEEIARRVSVINVADDVDIPPSVLLEAISDMGGLDDPKSFCDDRYRGTYESWSDFAEELTHETTDMSEIPDWLQNHIDWESIGRDFQFSGDFSAYRDGEFGDLYFFWCH